MAGRTLHVVSHTHWDREWYMSLDRHRRRLITLLDELLDRLDADPDFGSFHLDGQTIPLDDYLAVRPHQRARLAAAAQAGRLTVGPWYILQDEFLTSAEAQVRNLLYGLEHAREFGPPLMVGYLADAFGHIGQMPAILAGFGIDNAVFARGLKTIDPNAPADAPPSERGYPSELTWRAPSGDEVLVVYMSNWYANAMDLPSDPAALAERFRAITAATERYALTDQLLLMNGCDHTPCQLHISELLATAREQLDDTIIHSRLDDYVAAVRAAKPDLPLAEGELRSEWTNGWGTLTNVLSARLYIKQANWRAQKRLEQHFEPLQALAGLAGAPVDRDFRRHMWKRLLENHPHDSICGCSVDHVHREMMTRFAGLRELSDQLITEQMEGLAARVDTTCAVGDEVPVVVFNPLGHPRREMVTVTVEFPEGTPGPGTRVVDANGTPVRLGEVMFWGPKWGFRLPADRFRETYTAERMDISFEADLPAFGTAVYRVVPPAGEGQGGGEPWRGPQILENATMRVFLREDGLYDLELKGSEQRWEGLGELVLGRDIGDEYIYRAPAGDVEHAADEQDGWTVDSGGRSAHQRAHFKQREFPTTAEDEDWPFFAGELRVIQRISLPTDEPRLEVWSRIINQSAQSYRLRVLFPTDAKTEVASADGHFEVVERSIATHPAWTNPSNCQPNLDFVDVSDQRGGLTVANRGLPEYEVLRDGRNTIALTLLRGVDRLGDWGDFPTPEAQCRGANTAEFAVIPHAGGLRGSGADLLARGYNTAPVAIQTDAHPGAAAGSLLALEPAELVISAVRWAEDREAFLVRFYNPYAAPVSATLRVDLPVSHAWRCRLDESRTADLGALVDGALRIDVGGREIVTIELG